MSNKPLIKLFKTRGKYYLFDTNKNAILNINNEQYETVRKYMESNNEIGIDLEFINNLRKEGYLSSNRVKEIVSPVNEILSYYLENNMEQIILQLTQQCNFRCEYCVYSGNYYNRVHSSKRMDYKTAIKAIDFAISHSKDSYRLAISFYGGEPLLEFDLLKKCIEYVEEKAEGKLVEFYMTTNGYLLSGEILEFLYKHKVRIKISFDGPKEIHNGHRKLALNNSGTFDKVFENIKNIKSKFSDYMMYISFSTVVDMKNDFYTIDNFFKNNEVTKSVDITVSPISENNRKKTMEESKNFYIDREYEVFREMYYLVRKRNNKSKSKLTEGIYDKIMTYPEEFIQENRLSDKLHPAGPCIAGSKRLFVSVNGSFYPCEKCNESSELFKIGDLDSGFDVEKIRKLINIGKINEDECKNCWAINQCKVCAAQLDSSKNEFTSENKRMLCKGSKADVEEDLKNYCVLKEFGYDFKNENKEMKLINYCM